MQSMLQEMITLIQIDPFYGSIIHVFNIFRNHVFDIQYQLCLMLFLGKTILCKFVLMIDKLYTHWRIIRNHLCFFIES